MPSEMMQYLASQGIFAFLFGWLLWYVLKENSKRDKNYQKTIQALADKFNIVENIQEDIKEIKQKVLM